MKRKLDVSRIIIQWIQQWISQLSLKSLATKLGSLVKARYYFCPSAFSVPAAITITFRIPCGVTPAIHSLAYAYQKGRAATLISPNLTSHIRLTLVSLSRMIAFLFIKIKIPLAQGIPYTIIQRTTCPDLSLRLCRRPFTQTLTLPSNRAYSPFCRANTLLPLSSQFDPLSNPPGPPSWYAASHCLRDSIT